MPDIDYDPKNHIVNGIQYATLEAAMKAYTAAMNAARPVVVASPRKARRLQQIEEMKQGGVIR